MAAKTKAPKKDAMKKFVITPVVTAALLKTIEQLHSEADREICRCLCALYSFRDAAATYQHRHEMESEEICECNTCHELRRQSYVTDLFIGTQEPETPCNISHILTTLNENINRNEAVMMTEYELFNDEMVKRALAI